MSLPRVTDTRLMGLFGRSYNRAMLVENFFRHLIDDSEYKKTMLMLNHDLTLLCEYGSLDFYRNCPDAKNGKYINMMEVYLPKITVFQFALYRASIDNDCVLLHKIMACIPRPIDVYDFEPCSLQKSLLEQLNELYEHGLTYKNRKPRSDLPLGSYDSFKKEWSSISDSIMQFKENFDANSEIVKVKQELSEDWMQKGVLDYS